MPTYIRASREYPYVRVQRDVSLLSTDNLDQGIVIAAGDGTTLPAKWRLVVM